MVKWEVGMRKEKQKSDRVMGSSSIPMIIANVEAWNMKPSIRQRLKLGLDNGAHQLLRT